MAYCVGLFACANAIWIPASADDAPSPPAGASSLDKRVDVLRLPGVRLERSTAGLDDTAALPLLSDGDASTVAHFKAVPGAPLDVVYGFGGATVTVEQLTVQLPETAAAGRVEILVSTVSPLAGFHSLRADPLKSTADPQPFKFRPVAARWIMLRLTPAPGQDSADIAEISVLGREGEPASHYAFKQSPVAAFDVLARLKTVSGADVSLSDDERSLFADAADGKLNQWTLEDAALLAEGLQTADARAPYIDKLVRIEADAVRAIGDGGTPFERGGRLLKWLYRKGYLKGYEEKQTNLSGVLDNGHYNCVSSALLYVVEGQHLGLDVRAIEVPDHAFAVLYDGIDHADVETTAEYGFNLDRDPNSIGFFKRLTGFTRPADDKRELRREVSAIGLAAEVFYNHGVLDAEAGRYTASLGDYFRALSLDPENAAAVQNTLATIGNWGVALAQAGQYREATQELGVGVALAPDDAQLAGNDTAVWERWVMTEVQAGRRDQALTIVREAEGDNPRSNIAAMETWVYISPAEELAKRGDVDGAIAIVDPARSSLQGQQLSDLEQYEAGLYNREALDQIGRKDWAAAQAIYAAASERLAHSSLLRQNELYVWNNWANQHGEAHDYAGMQAVLDKALQRFPDDSTLRYNDKVARLNTATVLAQHADYESALKVVERAARNFPGDADVKKVRRMCRVNWSVELIKGGQWQQAVDVAESGLKDDPADDMLSGNELAAWEQWIKSCVDRGDWQAAIDVLGRARQRFAANGDLANEELYCWTSWVKATADRSDWAQALALADRGLQRFPGEEHLQRQRAICQGHAAKNS